ncbi:MAG: TonB C-terminal domain-containing protein [Pontiella sp.]
MNTFQRKVALRIAGIHVVIILCIMMMSGLKGCFRPKEKLEIEMFVEFGQAAPAVAIQEVAQMSEPEPEPAPAPPPEPVPAPLPEPVKKTIPKPTPKKEVPKPQPKPKPEPKKPKWTPTDVSEIKLGKTVAATKPIKPAVSSAEIQQALRNVQSRVPTSAAGPVGNPNADAAYVSQIGSYFDRRWTKPRSSAPSASTIFRIYISKWGTITRSVKIQGSGDAAFDDSVARAIHSVSTVPKPPSSFSYDYVEVEFRIRD